MRLEWVNHACFILDHDGVRLISDPWLDGLAFDHGWRHIVPTEFQYEAFESITHIWVSHEHPDHFAPRNLLRIPAEYRAQITMLFHREVDYRIGAFCRNAGFKEVRELQPGEWLSLAADLRIRCEDAGSGDTWFAARSAETTLLNVNDSILREPAPMERIGRMVGAPIDVLMTQYSYANWVGNPDQPERHQTEARLQLEYVRLQAEVLRPRYLIPFASMVWFCHVENEYLNAAMNTVEDAYRVIENETHATPLVLFPGESWVIGAQHDSEASLAKYRPFYAAPPAGESLVTSPSVAVPELQRLAARFFRILERHNPRWALWLGTRLGMLKPARIWLWDHEAAFALAPQQGLTPIQLTQDACDVAMSSESLAYMLRYLWGGSTVLINGRFRVPPAGDHRRFRRYSMVATFNNRGWTMLRYAPIAFGRLRDRLRRRRRRPSQRSLES